jgi:cytochrome c oxidase cbb3-type subunit 2
MTNEGRRMSVAWLWLAPLLLVVLVALVQWLPLITLAENGHYAAENNGRPYTALELLGYGIYLREGCSHCHSQSIRALERDVMRYGHYSIAAESQFDHPTLWGARRYGPDLAHIGGQYPDSWYRHHLAAPQLLVPGSIMPRYGWLEDKRLGYADLPGRLRALRRLGIPYSLTPVERDRNQQDYGEALAGYYDIHQAQAGLLEQTRWRDYDGIPSRVTEMDALIAYLQTLGSRSEPVREQPATDGTARY